MDAKEKLEMLIAYERIDMPKDKKQKAGWSMYISQKIVNFISPRELTLLMNFPLESIQNPNQPNIFGYVASRLLHG